MTEELKPTNHCSFCGNGKDAVKKLIVGDNVAICSDCVSLCEELIQDDQSVKTEESTPEYYPESIKEYLDEHIIGQNDAKMVLSVAISNHY